MSCSWILVVSHIVLTSFPCEKGGMETWLRRVHGRLDLEALGLITGFTTGSSTRKLLENHGKQGGTFTVPILG